MFTEQILSSLINIIPFWSSNIVLLFGLGNEYTVALNLILTQLLKLSFEKINDAVCVMLILTCFIIIGMYKFGFKLNINLFEKKIIELTGIEPDGDDKLIYSNKINIINHYLINITKIKNIRYHNDAIILINNLINYNIYKNIYLNITRVKRENGTLVTYKLWSYTDNIDLFIKELEDTLKNVTNSQIILIGDESNSKVSYPTPIHALNYYISINYKFPNFKCMLNNEQNFDTSSQNNILLTNTNNNNNNNNNTNTNNTNTNTNTNNTTKLNYHYTIDNMTNFKLFNDDILLTVYRETNRVYYNIQSINNNDCKDWIDKITNIYNKTVTKELTNKLLLTGMELIWNDTTNYKKYYYSKSMWALNWYVIEQLNYQHFECANGSLMVYNYILEPITFLKLEEDLYLTITKTPRHSEHSSITTKYTTINQNTDVVYTLYSNTKNIKNILDNYLTEFNKFNNNVSNNTIYHFIYNGLKDNNLMFTTKILSIENTNQELFETFDKLHNEHIDRIKKDIDKLKDLNYYKLHGLKRKKGYLFHGIPGCGKTSTVVSMALYDKRHIIEIPFSLLSKQDEFEKIMNLTNINDIEVNKNNIILLFDEIDIGMTKIGNRNNNIPDNDNDTAINMNNVITQMLTCPTSPESALQDINLGTLLSKLDGIGNYNGLIIVATTNYIEKLDPALYRELRLTPIKFEYLRKIDCIKIIQSYFGINYNINLNDIIKDRIITPTKLITLCQQHEDTEVDTFFNKILIDYF
jgi:ATP-dependent 26S proteasome regulatory subunit